MTSIYNIFLLLGVGQCLFLLVGIPTKSPLSYNKTLKYLILIAGIMICGKLHSYAQRSFFSFAASAIADTTIFLFGPLMYLYIRQVINREGSTQLPFMHYTPAIVHLAFSIILICLPREDLVSLFNTSMWPFLMQGIEAGGLLSMIIYSYLSYKICFFNSSNQIIEKEVHKYFLVVLGVISLFVTFWAIGYVGGYIMRSHLLYNSYSIMWMITPAFFYVIGFYAIRKPDVLRKNMSRQKPVDRLKSAKIQAISAKLDELIVKEQIHYNSDLTLNELAKRLDASPNDVSWLINSVYQKSFYNFINELRVNSFLQKLELNQHQKQTLLALANDVGFKSKSTFNKVFKEMKGLTPSEYVKSYIK